MACLQETGYYDDAIVINHDFNFNTTFFRALKSASFQTLQVLL